MALLSPVGVTPAAARSSVSVYPSSGTRAVSAGTLISFRGLPATRLGPIRVIGSRSGRHRGRLLSHSDGKGASFRPNKPFEGGERVGVRTDLRVRGAKNGVVRLTVARKGAKGEPRQRELPALRSSDVQSFRSRPDLHPPVVTVTTPASNTAPGHVFAAPKQGISPGQDGPMIFDNRGEVVWFHPVCKPPTFDFRVQRYRGKSVLTWWEGQFIRGYGRGEFVMADRSYREIARINAGRGYRANIHDLTITRRGTALLTAYHPVRRDLSKRGGHKRGTVMDNVIQEIDIETGLVLFEWHSYGRVPLDEGFGAPAKEPDDPWDYFHANSVTVDTDGNLLVSARRPRAVYKIDRETGAIMWRLGGKKSDFTMSTGAAFFWQHDAQRQPDGTITIFDNGTSPKMREEARGIVLSLDENTKRATLVREYLHPSGRLAPSQGNMQVLPNGNVLIGWGAVPNVTEFTSAGQVAFHAKYPARYNSYRAYRFPWIGRPPGDPAVAAMAQGNSQVTAYGSWNGRTDVASWQLLAGASPEALGPVGSAPRVGFETAITARTGGAYVAVRALNAAGKALGMSDAVKLGSGLVVGGAPASVTAERAQGVLGQRGVIVGIECRNGPCTVTVRGVVVIPGARPRARASARRLRLRSVKRSLSTGICQSRLKLGMSPSVRRAIRRALRRGATRRRLRAKLTVTVTDASGSKRKRKRSVRLTR